MYANIVVENKSRHTDMFFTYLTGNTELSIGDKVRIPFGTREKTGYVFSFSEETDVPEEKLREVIGLCEYGSLNEEIIKTCAWMKQRYAITYYDAIRCFVPNGKPPKEGKKKEPYKGLDFSYPRPEKLTDEQQKAFSLIEDAIIGNRQENFLIHGVTSSGKTEVYLSAIEKCLELGKTAVMLVPEISLTGQMIERFAGRFGKEKIAVLHSRLTQRERFDEWTRLATGEAKIAVGARMGVFAPLKNIGCIILDEEHEATYKADMTPKYDTCEVALKRLRSTSGVLILGYATPSVVSYERAKEGIYRLIELKKRYNETPLPRVITVDMREELKNGNFGIFSETLKRAMEETLERGEQVILLQNRRGYSNFISCRSCGAVMKCPECGISLTYHKGASAMVCHYCGKRFPVPKSCPECGSRYIKHFGVGTEQVEEACIDAFSGYMTERLDLDTVTDRKEMDRILKRFKNKKTDILVGTQLVAKGLDFDNVGLVGVIAADTSLNIPDYRSEERTFQLITQVAGRAGRGERQGTVVIQTYEPENYALTAAQSQDYGSFYKDEIRIRELMDYPPFGDLIMVNFTSDDEKNAADTADACRRYMQQALKDEGRPVILDPKLSGTFKGNDSFRYYIIIKCPRGKRNLYMHYLNAFTAGLLEKRNLTAVTVDVNPYSTV